MAVRSRPDPRLVALALAGAVLVLYARTAGFPFVAYDDPGYVRDNPHIAQGLTGASVRWAFTSTDYQYNWHPLTWLSHALDVQLFGLEDAGKHHLVNALLHALNAALVFLALRALTLRAGASALAAALFALHPLRVESVAWVAERKDVLAGTFFALTLLVYARYARAPSAGRYACVALALAGGLMAKPTLVTLPFLLLLLDFWPLRRFSTGGRRPAARPPSLAPTHPGETAEAPGAPFRYGVLLEKLPLLALALGSVVLTLAAQRAGGALDSPIPLGARLANAALGYATYLAQYVWPAGLAVFYPHPALVAPERSLLLPALAALALIALFTAFAWRLRRRQPWWLVGWGWFLGLLVPMIGLVQVGTQAHADRYAYLSALGLELALACGLSQFEAARIAWRAPIRVAAVLWLGLLALASARQLGAWQSSEALFRHALAHTERNYVAHNNLGLALGPARLDEALAQFEAAVAIAPRFFEAQLNLGKARYQRGELDEARRALERAVEVRPASGEAHLCLAWALFRTGEQAGARVELARARECDPALVHDERARRLGGELGERAGDG